MLKPVLTTMLKALSTNPSLLKARHPAIATALNAQGKNGSQGRANEATGQEEAFAFQAQEHGFRFWPKGTPVPEEDGLYYCYQIQGTQKSGDFNMRKVIGGTVRTDIVIDLKHTNSKSFYLNDGWFLPDVYYIVTWNAGTKGKPTLRTHIALGQDIPTEEENAFMKELQAFKAEKNVATKLIGSLRPYVRFANQYSCATFTAEKEATCLKQVLESLDVVEPTPKKFVLRRPVSE
jgi:hypothetical protein